MPFELGIRALDLAGLTPVTAFDAMSPSVTWADVGPLRRALRPARGGQGDPTAEDGRLACESGASAIVVSNHGGRQLDGVAATIDILPEVVEAVEGRIEVLLDGGIRRGTDVVKALALGARAVLAGRAPIGASPSAVRRAPRTCSSSCRRRSSLHSSCSAAGRPPSSRMRTSRSAPDCPGASPAGAWNRLYLPPACSQKCIGVTVVACRDLRAEEPSTDAVEQPGMSERVENGSGDHQGSAPRPGRARRRCAPRRGRRRAARPSAAALAGADLAYARLLVGAELLASDFYSQAIAASNASAAVTKYLKRAYLNEQEHYQSVAGILSGSGNAPAVSGDFDFSYPTGTFETESSILEFAAQLEATILGAYLGAIGGIQTNSFKTGLAPDRRLRGPAPARTSPRCSGGKAFSLSFPPALTIEQASDALDAYTA